MDIFLIVSIIVALVILLIVGVYLIINFQHPDDKNEAWVPKIVVLGGFVLAGAAVLLLPLDVANNEGYAGCGGWDTQLCGGLNMLLFWNIVFVLILLWLVVLIPFSTFFYEADDGMLMAGTSVGGNPNSRICEALKYLGGTLVIVGTIFTVCYFLLRETEIPVKEYTGPAVQKLHTFETQPVVVNGETMPFSTSQLANMTQYDVNAANLVSKPQTAKITLQVSVPTFFTAMLAFLGWFFFVLFGGIGLAALPLDLILIFLHRPRHMDAVEFADVQMMLRDRVNELVDIGEMIKLEREQEAAESSSGRRCFGFGGGGSSSTWKKQREDKKTLVQYRNAVYMLETDNQDFQNCTANYNSYNPLIPFAALFFGIIAAILSVLWILQIVIYVVPKKPFHPFLNSYFSWFDSWFPLFGVLSVAIFSVYLLFAAIKGCFKFGLRFLFFTLHPMEYNKTYMSSFLFNIGLILLTSVPVVQFSTMAFSQYAVNSNIYQVFGTQVQYLKFFTYFFKNNVFVYSLLCMALLTSLYLAICRRKDESKDSIVLRDRLKGLRE